MFAVILVAKHTSWETLELKQGSVQFTVLQRTTQNTHRLAAKAEIMYLKALTVLDIWTFKSFSRKITIFKLFFFVLS